MTPAGWYDDPLIPGGKRYWDGAQWTDHTQPPPTPAPPGAPPAGVPPVGPSGAGGQMGQVPAGTGTGFAGQPGVPPTAPPIGGPSDGPPPFAAVGVPHAPPGRPVYTGTGVNDIGDWIRRSFSRVFQQIGPMTLLFLPPAIIGAVAYLLLDQGLRSGVITDDGDFFGFDGALLAAAGLVFAVSVLVWFVANLAQHHNLYAGHVGHEPSAGDSFFAGLRSTPRYLGILLLLYLIFLLVFAAVAAIIAGTGLLLGENADVLIGLLIVVGYIGGLALSLWLSVKLAFVTVGAVVIPRGTSVIRTSWDVTRGFFWGILGRQILLGLLTSMIGMVVYFVGYLGLIALVFSQFGFTDDGRITVDGQDIETLTVFEMSDFLPNPILVIAAFTILGYLMYLVQTVVYSGTTALYADLRGPNVFGHGRR